MERVELKVKKLGKIATAVGSLALISSAIAAVCEGEAKKPTGGDGGPTQRATPEATSTSTPSPVETATPTQTPEALSRKEALAKLKELVRLVKNPNPELIAQLNIDPGIVESRIEGVIGGKDFSSYDVPGLNDVRVSILENDRVKAKEQLFQIFGDGGLDVFGSRTGEFTDSDSIAREEMDQLDPKFVFHGPQSAGEAVSALYKEALIKLINLHYKL